MYKLPAVILAPAAPPKVSVLLFVFNIVSVPLIETGVAPKFKFISVNWLVQFQVKFAKLLAVNPVGKILPLFNPVILQLAFVFHNACRYSRS